MAFSFNTSGSGTRIQKTGLTLQASNTDFISCCGWARSRDTSGPQQAVAISAGAVDNRSTGYRAWGSWQISSQPAATAPATTAVSNDAWHFFAFVVSNGQNTGDTNCYYANYGASILTQMANGTIASVNTSTDLQTAVVVGNRYQNDLVLTGDVAHIRVWKGKLTEAEFLAEMNSATMVKATGDGITRVLAWELDGNANDGTGNGNTGTLTGSDLSGAAWVAGPTLIVLPTVTAAGDATFLPDESITITGTGFGASQGSGSVLISPTDNVADGAAVAQAIGAWADTSITITAVKGTLAYGSTAYLFVKENGLTSNAAGYAVSFITRGPQRRMLLGIG